VKTLFEALFPQMRERVRADTGVTVPGVRVRSNDTDLPKDQYLIMIQEVPLVMGSVGRDKVFALGASGEPPQPFCGRSSVGDGSTFPPEGEWRDPDKEPGDRGREPAATWSHLEYLTRHVEFMVRLHLVQFFGVQEADNLLDEWLKAGLPNEAAQHIHAVREDHG